MGRRGCQACHRRAKPVRESPAQGRSTGDGEVPRGDDHGLRHSGCGAASASSGGLEDDCGHAPNHRETRDMALTGEGRLFLKHCFHILAEVDAAQAELSHAQVTPRGRLRVSLPRSPCCRRRSGRVHAGLSGDPTRSRLHGRPSAIGWIPLSFGSFGYRGPLRHHVQSEVTQGGATSGHVAPPRLLRSARTDGGAAVIRGSVLTRRPDRRPRRPAAAIGARLDRDPRATAPPGRGGPRSARGQARPRRPGPG